MPTRKGGYLTASGDRVPGVTTVIGANLGWNKEALMWWANQEGLAGRKHRETTTKAADIGTLAHAMVEAHINGAVYIPGDEDREALQAADVAFTAYLMWEQQTKLDIIATELCVVSEVHRYGGTLDAIGRIAGSLCLLDWKSASGTYADHLIQLAAYRTAFEESTGLTLDGGFHLCRFDKESGGFSHHWWPPTGLEQAWEAFVYLRSLHDLRRVLDRRAA